MEIAVLGSKSVLDKALADVPPSMLPNGITGGDTKLIWSSDNSHEVENARATFDRLKKNGFAAFAVKKNGDKGEQIFAFDPEAEKIIMTPQLRGGC